MKQILPRGFFFFIMLLSFAGCVSRPTNQTGTTVQSSQAAPANPEFDLAVEPMPAELILFNGKDLSGWQETDFGGRGEILVENGAIQIGMGAELSGVNWTNARVLPKTNYEIELDAMKLQGNDFFCALTFPANNSFCSFVVGGWGGGVVGISSIDGMDASENDTSRNLYFERNRWYRIRVQVTPQKIMAWIDKDKIVDVEITGRKITTRPGDIDRSMPLGIATWQTSSAVKNIKLKRL